jgi:hypothetical protein
MRTNARSLQAAAATLLLAASAATVSGCGNKKFDGPPAVFRNPINVVAVVTYNGKTTKMTTSQSLPDPKMVQLREGSLDTVQWLSPSGEVHIVKWTPKRPFDKDPVYEDGVLKSGPPSKGSHWQKDFKYEAELWVTNGPHVPIDPIIEIME